VGPNTKPNENGLLLDLQLLVTASGTTLTLMSTRCSSGSRRADIYLLYTCIFYTARAALPVFFSLLCSRTRLSAKATPVGQRFLWRAHRCRAICLIATWYCWNITSSIAEISRWISSDFCLRRRTPPPRVSSRRIRGRHIGTAAAE
jgi:hypothetical protein